MTRSRKNELTYQQYLKNRTPQEKSKCPLCHDIERNIVEEKEYFYIVRNIFGYNMWDSCDVVEHLMIVPKNHIPSFNDLKPEEFEEYNEIMKEYDKKGYSIYTRTNGSQMKSIMHLHTHLIKLGEKRVNSYFYNKKPYMIWFR